MNNEYAVWLFFLGAALGAGLTWLLVARLPRRADDLDPAERAGAARWISATIEANGGAAPPALVEQVLDLHAQYLAAGTSVAAEPSLAHAAEDDAAPFAPAPLVAASAGSALRGSAGGSIARARPPRGGTTVLPASMEAGATREASSNPADRDELIAFGGRDASDDEAARDEPMSVIPPSIRASDGRIRRGDRDDALTEIDDLSSTPSTSEGEDAGDVEERADRPRRD